jgi:hypothetical protein
VRLSCVTCADEPDPGQVAWATVHSSEREFEHERFAVWRCPRCRCIHAFGDVDLDRYYRRYGLHETGLDLLERVFYRNKLRFIRRFVPLDRGGPVLDFGCGNGVFVEYLRRRGYTDVAGYDPYSASHADPGVLGRRAPGTRRRTGRAGRLPLPPDPRRPPYRPGAGGNGPPGAQAALPPAPGHDGLARGRAQPARLRTRGQDPPPYFHTRIPFLNLPTIDWHLDRHGGLVALNEPFRWSSLLRPGFWYRGLAGGLVSRTDEVQLIFRRAG